MWNLTFLRFLGVKKRNIQHAERVYMLRLLIYLHEIVDWKCIMT